MASRAKPAANDSVRLDNAPLNPKNREDTHIAGEQELASAVDLRDDEQGTPDMNRQEVDEMEIDASAALADGMGADDARTEARAGEFPDTRDPELRTDLDRENQGDDDEDDAMGGSGPTLH